MEHGDFMNSERVVRVVDDTIGGYKRKKYSSPEEVVKELMHPGSL